MLTYKIWLHASLLTLTTLEYIGKAHVLRTFTSEIISLAICWM